MANPGQAARYGDQAQKDKATSDPGPTNAAIDAQNPGSFTPPPTDSGQVQTFKYPFSFAHKRLEEGGWSREVTVRELAVSKTLAGREYATHRWRHSRIALACGRGMGLHALRKSAYYRPGCEWTWICF